MAIPVLDITKPASEGPVATQDLSPAEAVRWTYRQLVLGDTVYEDPPGGIVPDLVETDRMIVCGNYGCLKETM